MAWEIVADFKRWKSMPADQRFWSDLAIGITIKLLELEPRLRLVLKNLPLDRDASGEIKNVFLSLAHVEVPAVLQNHITIPGGKPRVIRQYQCHTCGTEEKPMWVPQMYLPVHKDHKLTRSEPTGRVMKDPWEPNFRLFIGSPKRLRGLKGFMYSAALSSVPKDPLDLDGYDAVLLLPGKDGLSEERRKQILDMLASAEEATVLPAKTDEMVKALLDWMCKSDKEAIQPSREEEEKRDLARASSIMERLQSAKSHIDSLRTKAIAKVTEKSEKDKADKAEKKEAAAR